MEAFRERKSRGKLLPSEVLELSRGLNKPDVGCKPILERNIEAIRSRIRRTNHEMAALAKQLRYDETIDYSKVDRFQDLNEQLKACKVYEAEIVYLRNML